MADSHVEAGAAWPRSRWRPGLRRMALAAGLGFAFWVHSQAFTIPAPHFYAQVRWPYIAAGLFTMAFATLRPQRWMIIAVATAAPTALTGCYFIGSQLADGAGIPWMQVRIAITMLIATTIGGVAGRVAGGIRRGR